MSDISDILGDNSKCWVQAFVPSKNESTPPHGHFNIMNDYPPPPIFTDFF